MGALLWARYYGRATSTHCPRVIAGCNLTNRAQNNRLSAKTKRKNKMGTTKKLRSNEAVYRELSRLDWLGSNGIRRVTNPGGTVSLRIGYAGDIVKFIRESVMSSGAGMLPETEVENMVNWVENIDTCADTFILCDSYDTPQVIYNRTTGVKYVTGVKYSTTTSGHRNAFSAWLN